MKINKDEFNRNELAHISHHSPFSRYWGMDAEIYGVNSVGLITSVLWLSKKECDRCDGTGEIECCECGHESECQDCDGEGSTNTNRCFVTRCDGATIINVFDHETVRGILECSDENLFGVSILKDAWEVV